MGRRLLEKLSPQNPNPSIKIMSWFKKSKVCSWSISVVLFSAALLPAKKHFSLLCAQAARAFTFLLQRKKVNKKRRR